MGFLWWLFWVFFFCVFVIFVVDFVYVIACLMKEKLSCLYV